jgi:hypothetical protein
MFPSPVLYCRPRWRPCFLLYTNTRTKTINMNSSKVSAAYFEQAALGILNRRRVGAGVTWLRRFVGMFGLEPIHCAVAWNELVLSGWTGRARYAKPVHLLWALHFLRVYPTEEVLAARVGADEKTVRKWVWFYVNGIARLTLKIVCMMSSCVSFLSPIGVLPCACSICNIRFDWKIVIDVMPSSNKVL